MERRSAFQRCYNFLSAIFLSHPEEFLTLRVTQLKEGYGITLWRFQYPESIHQNLHLLSLESSQQKKLAYSLVLRGNNG
jgi:hypothetical protein